MKTIFCSIFLWSALLLPQAHSKSRDTLFFDFAVKEVSFSSDKTVDRIISCDKSGACYTLLGDFVELDKILEALDYRLGFQGRMEMDSGSVFINSLAHCSLGGALFLSFTPQLGKSLKYGLSNKATQIVSKTGPLLNAIPSITFCGIEARNYYSLWYRNQAIQRIKEWIANYSANSLTGLFNDNKKKAHGSGRREILSLPDNSRRDKCKNLQCKNTKFENLSSLFSQYVSGPDLPRALVSFERFALDTICDDTNEIGFMQPGTDRVLDLCRTRNLSYDEYISFKRHLTHYSEENLPILRRLADGLQTADVAPLPMDASKRFLTHY